MALKRIKKVIVRLIIEESNMPKDTVIRRESVTEFTVEIVSQASFLIRHHGG